MHQRTVRLCLASAALASFALASLQDPDEPAHDGKWLYTRNCSGCHNDNGDGKGATIVQMGLTARDFKQGGFAFGDSPEQIKRVITSGIPGRSPMPSFKGVLSDEEMDLVVEHVRTLMPPRDDEKPRNSEMIVEDRPLIARGKLPPIEKDAPEIARGLLIGTPEGMTFEYDINDVRLLGVRLGRFANREDWRDRGGGYLKPLGQVVFRRTQDGAESRTGTVDKASEARRVLRSTWTNDKGVGLTYECIGVAGGLFWRCYEVVCAATLSVGAGYTRFFDLEFGDKGQVACLCLGDALDSPWSALPLQSGVWYSRKSGEDGFEAVFVRGDGVQLKDPSRPNALLLALSKFGEPAGYTLWATTVHVREWTPELAAKLAEELGQ